MQRSQFYKGIFFWLLAGLFYFYAFLLQVSPSVMVPQLMADFRVDGATLGRLISCYLYAYAAMQVPAGVFLDTLGPRKLLSISCLICAIGTLVFAVSGNLLDAALGRTLIGFGSAFSVVGTLKIAANWFPAERFGFLSGLTLMCGMLGALGAGVPVSFMLHHFHWRSAVLIFAGVGFLLAVLLWLGVRDKPKKAVSAMVDIPQANIWQGLLRIMVSKQNWLTALYGALMFGPITAFAGLWGVSFIQTKYEISRTLAASTVSMIFIGWAIGSPILGSVSDYLRRRKPTLVLAAIGSLATLTPVIYCALSLKFCYLLLFCFGFFNSGFLPSFSIVKEINPIAISGTAIGYMNLVNTIGGAVLQPVIGELLDAYWTGALQHGARVYSLLTYYHALWVLPLAFFIALLLIPFICETYCQHVRT